MFTNFKSSEIPQSNPRKNHQIHDSEAPRGSVEIEN